MPHGGQRQAAPGRSSACFAFSWPQHWFILHDLRGTALWSECFKRMGCAFRYCVCTAGQRSVQVPEPRSRRWLASSGTLEMSWARLAKYRRVPSLRGGHATADPISCCKSCVHSQIERSSTSDAASHPCFMHNAPGFLASRRPRVAGRTSSAPPLTTFHGVLLFANGVVRNKHRPTERRGAYRQSLSCSLPELEAR